MKRPILLIVLVVAAILRLSALNRFPAGLNADEAALGYNAYSLIQTGKDEHGTPWPLEFRSFDDYKPGVYVYLTLPFVYLFGLNEWSVRLPSALLSLLTVYLIYFLTNQLLPDLKFKAKPFENWNLEIGHLAALLLALSPWHLHFSRGGWEVNAATTFLLLSLWAFLKALKNYKFFVIWIILLVISLYTYHAMRIVAPLLSGFLILSNWKLFENWKLKIGISSAVLLGFILTIPLAAQFLSGSAASRFSGVGLFADSGPLSWVHERRLLSPDPDSFLTKLRFNRYTAYSFEFLKNYLSHYTPQFLFLTGDEIARSKVPGFGQSLHVFLPVFYLGLIYLFRSWRQKSSQVVLAWLTAAPIAAALTFQSPHALRSQNMVIPFTIITTLGIYHSLAWFKRKLKPIFLSLIPLLSLAILLNFAFYLNSYYYRYPRELPFAWQYGFKDLSLYLRDNQEKYDRIIISTAYDQPYILTAFYLQYPPALLQQQLVFSEPDKFGFSTGQKFDKYEFHPISWQLDSRLPNTLLIVTNETVPANIRPIHTIYYPNNQPVFKIYDTNQYLAKR